MNDAISTEQKEMLHKLLMAVVSLHSFTYSTLAEAQKTVCLDDIVYCFDALSLCLYSSNLNPLTNEEFSRMLNKYYRENFNSEEQKERAERTSLFQYLTSDSCPYKGYRIIKKTRPDFVLEGDGQRIGIEVVELTTPVDQVLFSISREYYGQGKTVDEIKKAAEQEHGGKARNYKYWEINGSAYIGTGLFDSGEKQKHFSCQLFRKYKKYAAELPYFDRFIVLGDALRSGDITVSGEEDVNNIFEWLEAASDLRQVSFVILWQRNCSSGYSVSQYDA